MPRDSFSKTSSFALICWWLSIFTGSDVMAAVVVDTSGSEFAKVGPVGFDEVRWTDGFWEHRTTTCFQRSVPSMWELMESGKYKPFLGHFLIAAGQAEGGHHGAKWNDGDFYKWLEAAIVTVAVTGDERLKLAIDRSINAISAAQRYDGYLHTPVLIAQRNGDDSVKPFQDRKAFEMYNLGHLITTACIHHRVTGETKLLNVGRKAADFLIDTFSDPTPELARNAICPSHYMAAVELYRTTGERRYLDLANTFLDMRNLVTEGGDDNQDRVPFVKQREIVGHAVRANYLYAGAADLYAETGNEQWRIPLEPLWENMVGKKLYITGACGALYDGASPDGSSAQRSITRVHQAYGRNYQLPNTTAHNETCANIGNLLWSWRMFLLTGEAKYIDVLELALYNSILSGVSLSGSEYFYVNPLRVVEPMPTHLRYPRTRQSFFTSFCCPPNLVRTIAEVSGYAYSKSDDLLWVNLYGANQLESTLLGEPIQVVQNTKYPWDGLVHLSIQTCPKQAFVLKLRVPNWSSAVSLEINGDEVAVPKVVNGYIELRRNWQPGDEVFLNLPMAAKLLEAHPLVEDVSNHVAVQRGPIVYCLESHDLPKGTKIQHVLMPVDIALQARFDPDMLGGVTILEGTAEAIEGRAWNDQLYREVSRQPTKEMPVKLIPYFTWANRGKSEMSVWLPVMR